MIAQHDGHIAPLSGASRIVPQIAHGGAKSVEIRAFATDRQLLTGGPRGWCHARAC